MSSTATWTAATATAPTRAIATTCTVGDRLIEAPKDRLKAAQRRILRDLVAHVPPHEAAHGFVAGRSPRTHAVLHTGAPWVVRVDLRRFFATITAGRVAGWLRSLGYPPPVTGVLAGLVTTWTPPDITLEPPWSQPHLPQGAPTSPAIANALCFGLDRRLTGLARHHRAVYSRYPDDLTFSGRDWDRTCRGRSRGSRDRRGSP